MSSERPWYTNETCSIARTLDVIGERWTILVLREAFMRVRRFDEFQRNIGLARNILSARLRKLVEAGVLARRQYSEKPPRFEYRLTERGLELYPALVALMEWGDRHVANPAGPPVTLRHMGCGRDSTPHMVCSECGEPIGPRDMQPRPGRGALSADPTASPMTDLEIERGAWNVDAAGDRPTARSASGPGRPRGSAL